MINKAQAINLTHGDEIHYDNCRIVIGPRGGEQLEQERWRVSGMVKTWKTRPHDFRVPIKYGMYASAYLDNSNASQFHLAVQCAPFHKCPECTFENPCPTCDARNAKARKEAKI